MVKQKTGLVLDPYFSATKIQWILDNVPNARKRAESGELLFGTIDSFLIFNLSKQKNHMTDVTNASRTMLFNINDMSWDKDLLDLFNIPFSMMPKVAPCDGEFGNLIFYDININGVIGDQQSALVWQHCINYGDMKSTYGTCLLYTSPSPRDGLLSRMPSSA